MIKKQVAMLPVSFMAGLVRSCSLRSHIASQCAPPIATRVVLVIFNKVGLGGIARQGSQIPSEYAPPPLRECF